MKVQFYAKSVIIAQENEVITTVFLENEEGFSELFMFQYALFEGVGQPIYCERNDQSQACYDGVEKAALTLTGLDIIFKDVAMSRIRCKELEINFNLDNSQFNDLKENLILVFAGTSLLTVN